MLLIWEGDKVGHLRSTSLEPGVKWVPCLFKEHGCIKVWSLQQVCEEVFQHKEFLIRLKNVIKPSLKSLDSTNPQSDRLRANEGNSRSCYSPQGGWPTKITLRTRCLMLHMVTKFFVLFFIKENVTFQHKKLISFVKHEGR